MPLELDSDRESIMMNNLYLDLQEYRDGLIDYTGVLKKEIVSKKAELVNLDKELIELERQYNELLNEKKRISDKLNSLNAGEVY
jgi:chromosome segregation ATPase